MENILLLSQTGMALGDALADVVLGKAYPSGKLASTWAKWEDYCQVGDFAQPDDTHYTEGVYVGYRYFDSVGKEPLFPFGYGLGYTTFSLGRPQAAVEGTQVTVRVPVKNTGTAPGKEVVQLYASVPSGKLDQPYQALAAFAKTGELAPGGEEELTLTFALESLASFAEESACSILEAGGLCAAPGHLQPGHPALRRGALGKGKSRWPSCPAWAASPALWIGSLKLPSPPPRPGCACPFRGARRLPAPACARPAGDSPGRESAGGIPLQRGAGLRVPGRLPGRGQQERHWQRRHAGGGRRR